MKRSHTRPIGACAVLLAGWMTSLDLRAAELAYDGFAYPAGTSNLTGQSGGHGWNGVWRTVNNGSADMLAGGLSGAASVPAGYDARSTGGSANLPTNRRVGRKLDTSAAGPFGSRGYVDGAGRIGADGKTIYLSFLQQPNGTSLYYEFEFHRGDLGDPGRIAGIGNDQGGDNVHLRAPGGTHTLIGPGTTGVNFYVVRIDFKAGNDDVYIYRNPTSAGEPATATLTRLNAADMSFDGLSFGAFVGSRTVAHDEVRLGESWEDVTVPAAAAPVVTKQPKASTAAFAGSTVTLHARFSGQPLPTYQWFKGTAPLPGETGASLTLTNVDPSATGDYHVTATNTQGGATTSAAHVEVTTPPAGLLVYDGFDYDAGTGALAGRSGGLGWGANWVNVNGGGGSIVAGNLSADTNAPNGYDGESTGNCARIPNNQRDGRLVDTSPGGRLGSAGYIDGNGNVGADGTTLYLSFLQQPDGTTKFYEFEFHRGNLGDPGRIGGIGNDTGNPTVALRTGGAQNLIGPASTGVNFYVVRIDYKAGNDDVRVYQNPVSSTEPALATLSVPNAADMSFNGLSIAAFDNGRTVKHDEIRLGTAWSDVVFGTSRRDLVWSGDGVANAWDFATANWDDGTSFTAFADGDPVTFDDSGSDTPAVDVTTDVATAGLVVNNTSNHYTFSGTGTITSSGGMTKSGTGDLVFTAPAVFGGTVTIHGGNVSLNGTSTVSGNLQVNGGAGDLVFGGANTFDGSLLDTGSGARVFSGSNTFAGISCTNAAVAFSGTSSFTGGGSVIWFGSQPGSSATVSIEPGADIGITGNYNDALVFGRDGGSAAVTQTGGTLTYNPANQTSAFLGASGANTGTSATYDISGGTLDMANKRLGIALGGAGAGVTADFTQTGGNVLVRQLDVGANLTEGTGSYTLEAGTLAIGAGGITSTSGLYTIGLGGGTVAAAADWNSALYLDLTGTGGDTTFDTAGHTVTLDGVLDGAGGLVKTGAGTLVLTNFNAFSGDTVVQAGTLAGVGNSDNSALQVDPGAAVAPGAAGIASFACGSAVMSAGSTLEIGIDSTADLADQLYSFGAIDISGAGVSFAEVGSGTIDAGTELVIVEADTLTGTFAGLPEGSSVSVGANTFTIHYGSADVTLTSTTVPDPYLNWAAARGLDGTPGKDPAFDADPDNDGVASGIEWMLAGDPLSRETTPLYDVAAGSGTGLTLSFTREEESLGATLMVQWTTDPGSGWTDVPITQTGGSHAGGVTVTINETPSPDEVEVVIPAVNATQGALFARLRAILP